MRYNENANLNLKFVYVVNENSEVNILDCNILECY